MIIIMIISAHRLLFIALLGSTSLLQIRSKVYAITLWLYLMVKSVRVRSR